MVDSNVISKFLQQIHDSIDIVMCNKNIPANDERLSPMTYKKLKELGYSSEDWHDWSQEHANEIVRRGIKQNSKSENAKNLESYKSKKLNQQTLETKPIKKLAYEEDRELYEKLTGPNAKGVTYDEIINSNIVNVLKNKQKDHEKSYREKYNLPDNFYTSDDNTEDRNNLRKQWAKELLSRGSISGYDENGKPKYDGPVKKEYRAEIVLGAPAAGKSSVIVDKVSKKYGSQVVDSDEIKQLIPEFNGGIGANLVHEESSDIVLNTMVIPEYKRGGINNGNNIVIPIVGSNPRTAKAYLNLLKNAGYTVHLSLNEVDSKTSLSRSIIRAIETGRFQSPEYLISVGNKPTKTYEYLKSFNEDGIHFDSFTKYNNDVPKGQPAQLIEHENYEE